MNSPVNAGGGAVLLIVIIQLIGIVGSSRFWRNLSPPGQPQVCGEIAAGLILGPFLFAGFFPLPWKEAWSVAMNTRGLMELNAVNLGHDRGHSWKRIFHAGPHGRGDHIT